MTTKLRRTFSLLGSTLALTVLACDEGVEPEAFEASELEASELEAFELEVAEPLDHPPVELDDYEFVVELDNLAEAANPHSLDVRERWGLDLDDGVYMIHGRDLYRLRGEVPSMPRFAPERLANPGATASGEVHGEPAEWAFAALDDAPPSSNSSALAAEGSLDEFEPSPSADPYPHQMLGADNRSKVGNPSGWYPARSVGKLLNGCTATLIGPRHALTAAHCIDGGGAISFVPGQNGDNTTPKGGPYPATHILLRVASNVLYDYGIIGLPNSPTLAGLGWLGMYWSNDMSWYEGKYAYLKGYPLSGQACPGGGTCDGFQWQHSGYINRDAQATGNYGALYYPLDATGGQSGSVVYSYINGAAAVLAVHKRGNESSCSNCDYTSDPADQNVGARITSTVFNDLCWMMSVVGPSSYASHPCTD